MDYPQGVWNAFFGLILFGVLFGALEGSGKMQLAYSKFRKGGKFNTRALMLMIYTLPALAYLSKFLGRTEPSTEQLLQSPFHVIMLSAFILHYGKRCLECLFLHRYSGPTGIITPLLIMSGYSFIASAAETVIDIMIPLQTGLGDYNALGLVIGGSLFLFGQCMNFYHHLILARLRSAGDKQYHVPEKGLFSQLACPHYFFEITAWLGFAIMSGHPLIFGFVFIMSSYLIGRSAKTLKWYRDNIPEYPAQRKAILPGIF